MARRYTHPILSVEDQDLLGETINQIEDITDEVRKQAVMLGPQEVRYLVDTYYNMQDRRKTSANQERALSSADEPITLVDFIRAMDTLTEKKIRQLLQAYAEIQPVSQWAMGIRGIGPVISAGLAAHIDIERAPTVGHIWRFFGLDPSQKWQGRKAADKLVSDHLRRPNRKTMRQPTEEDVRILADEMQGLRYDTVLRIATTNFDGSPRNLTATTLKSALAVRPHNARAKTLAWKIGESFVKVKNHPSDIYGSVYDDRKALEQIRNDAGQFAEQARTKLETTDIGHDTDAYKSYINGQLPPGHIHSRAKRYAVKLFLAHYHHVAYQTRYGIAPPKPYILTQEGHAHFIAPPNWAA